MGKTIFSAAVKSAVASVLAATVIATPALAQDLTFSAWLEGFRAEAEAAGVDAEVITTAFSTVNVNERVLELNDNQPEFSRALWDYLDSALAQSRIDGGTTGIAANRNLLGEIEEKYGVDAEIITAIWGLESSYGAIMGNHDAIGALATLGWKGRRTGYGREQLIGALKILQNGYATREELRGSWAGAMGQTQFIPTTYLVYAVDHDGDGRRDIWGNMGDVFASTANYLSASKYTHNTPWGVEIKLPEGFDYALADPSVKKPLAEWASSGISGAKGSLLASYDPNLRGRLIVPAGARGPAFVVFGNFEAILKYNRSTAYALAVGMLSDHVAGRDGGVRQSWPRNDRPLSLSERKKLQQALTDKGFEPGPVDGIIGAGTKKALREWQKSQGLPADGYASADILLKITS